MCYMRGIDGLGFDNGHNYRRWTLIASPTVFHDDDPRYVYIAIPKSNAADIPAQVVWPSEELDIYGCNEGGTQVGSTDYYYIWTRGIISASRVNGVAQDRVWSQVVDTGTLASDEAIASGGEGTWWEYIATTDMVKFLKTISEAVFEKLTASWASITQLVLHGHTINGVANPETVADANANDKLVTPAYAKTQYLSRTHDDTANGDITFNNSILVKGETVLKRSVTIGDYEKDIQVGIGSRTGSDELVGLSVVKGEGDDDTMYLVIPFAAKAGFTYTLRSSASLLAPTSEWSAAAGVETISLTADGDAEFRAPMNGTAAFYVISVE